MKSGTVFNIQRFCVHDGPGIRTTVFLKGCPLNCLWCHNPESKSAKPEIFYNGKKCIACGKCTICQSSCHSFENGLHCYNRQGCISCGECAAACPAAALEQTGKIMSVDEVISEAVKDKPFYETSGGGITLSGGEPMAQPLFSIALLRKAKEEGLHTCIETCGYADRRHFEEIAQFTDIFLFDYKETDEQKHSEFTGVSNRLILENLHILDEMGKSIVLRCPIIPTLNDTDEHFEGIAKTANSLKNIIEVNIEPYHPLGKGKSELLGKGYSLEELGFPEESTVLGWIEKISAKTDVKVLKN